MKTRRLVLVGGGHAHLEVLRAAALRPMAAELVLVSREARQLYSGMMPAQLRGHVTADALTVALPALCRAAGARFVEGVATRIDAGADGGTVVTDAHTVDGDVLSLDVGSGAAALDTTPDASEHVYPVRPLGCWDALVARVEALLARPGREPLACCVVGAGAGGVELALALHARVVAAGRTPHVTLVDSAPRLLGGWRGGGRECVRHIIETRGIAVRDGARVAAVDAQSVALEDGTRVPSDVTIWVTGAAALPLARASGLPVDDGGYLRVDDTLRAEDGRAVWGAGDCVTLASAPWVPKSGVYAVRQGPLLAHNLRAAVEQRGTAPRRYTPQRRALVLLDTADGRAVAHWGGLTLGGQWAWWLKQAIDARFVRRYQRLGRVSTWRMILGDSSP